MSQAKRRNPYQKQETKRKSPLALILVLIGLAIIGLGAFFALRGGSNQTTSNESGTPKLELDKKQIDFGDQHFGNTVTATFKLTNAGTATLRFQQPTIEVKEGC